MNLRPLLLLIFILQGCSADSAKVEDFEVNFVKLNLWNNLMPGGPPSFHTAGELSVKNNSGLKIDNFTIGEIIIEQRGRKIYKFTPSFTAVPEYEDLSLEPAEEKRFLFSTSPGLNINPDLIDTEPLKAAFHFKADIIHFYYFADSLTLEKAY